MLRNQSQLVEALVAGNLLTRQAADDLLKKSSEVRKTPEELIIEERLITDKELLATKSKILNTPVADFQNKTIDKKVLNLIPKEVAENYQMIPFEKEGSELRVGLVNPQNFKAIEAVEFLAQKAGLKIRYFIISPTSFRLGLRQYQALGEEVKQALAGINEQQQVVEKTAEESLKEMEEVIKSAPVSKMVLVIVRHAIDGRASDIHIEPTTKDTKVRYRIDGILRTSLVLPKYIHSAIVARIKVLANLKLDETRKPQDGRIRLNIEGRDIDFRVSTLPLFEGEKVVLRILDSNAQIPSLDQLGFNSIHIETIKEAIKKPNGLLLLTGPTGSGKTTTLYTILTMINKDGINIVTLEDPIEYYVDGVNQSQINQEINYTFASGLRAILRQDPNVVMLGEIRDKETTELVIHASLTGHLMLSTLHTNNSVGAIPRLIDLGAEPFLLSSVMNVVIAQRLARKLCPNCKQETKVPELMMKKVKSELSQIPKKYLEGLEGIDIDKPVFYKGAGCASCGNLGYQGRTAVSEILEITPEVREAINRGGNTIEINKMLKSQNFITLTQDCLIKALKAETTLDEVMRVSQLN
ncbi:MAG: type II/IV secretion system protein [Candidatus Buchananbacteria bacterium]|nr:type II/IV secretion system protein [Candidatus Buchananbacteria bacterium]